MKISKILTVTSVVMMLLLPGMAVASSFNDTYGSVSAEQITAVPNGWIPIYDASDLSKIGSGTLANDSQGGGPYDWRMNDKYILMNDVTIAAGISDMTAAVTVQTGNVLELEVKHSSSSLVTGTVWLDNEAKDLASGMVSFNNYDGKAHRVIIGGMVNGTKFAYSFVLDGMVNAGTTVNKEFAQNGNFKPIGSTSTPFSGKFNGNGHEIKGLDVRLFSDSASVYAGLFAAAGNQAEIYGLTLKDNKVLAAVRYSAYSDVSSYAGGIAGALTSGVSIKNCIVSGETVSALYKLGSTSGGAVSSSGGIVGLISIKTGSVTIDGCVNNSSIVSTETIKDSQAAMNAYAGGIVGRATDSYWLSNIINCENNGKITSTASLDHPVSSRSASNVSSYAGGIAGIVSGVSISDCKNNAAVKAKSTSVFDIGRAVTYAGGIAGYTYDSFIRKCTNLSDVTADSNVTKNNDGSVLYPLDPVPSATSYAGGMAGFMRTVAVSDCYNKGNVTSNATSNIVKDTCVLAYVGGIAAEMYYVNGPSATASSVERSYNSGDLTATANSTDEATIYAGGLIGRIDTAVIVRSCYNTGNTNAVTVSSVDKEYVYVGGMAGSIGSGGVSLENSYNAGSIYASSEKAYKAGAVAYSSYTFRAHGLISMNTASDKMFTNGFVNDEGSSFRSIEEMKKRATYNDWQGFSTIWSMDSSVNNGLPFFGTSSVMSMYTITFDTSGGDAVASITAANGETVSLPTPVKGNTVFKGWYTGPNGTGDIVNVVHVSSDVTLYAAWEGSATPLKSPSSDWLLWFVIVLLILSAIAIIVHYYRAP